MVEEIKELKPKLQVPSLAYVRVFISGEIGLGETRLTELLRFLVAIGG